MPDIQAIGQQVGNSCGAFSLAAVANALNKVPASGIQKKTIDYTPDDKKTGTKRKTSFDPSSPPSTFAQEIYQLTGNLNEQTFQYLEEPTKLGFNSVSGLVKIAQELGLNCVVNVAKDSRVTNLPIYSTEKDLVKKLGGIVNENAVYNKPQSQHHHLICVLEKGYPTHWIALGTDLIYYDPRYNTNNTSWDITQSHKTMSNYDLYEFSGLWIDLSA
jgi:hypothetical protein